MTSDTARTAAFTGRGPWKRRIPQILAALGRARVVNAGVMASRWLAGVAKIITW